MRSQDSTPTDARETGGVTFVDEGFPGRDDQPDWTARPEDRTGSPRPAALADTVGPVRAAFRYPLLLLLSVLVVLLPALTLALSRTPVYRAQSEVLVGRVDVEANAVPGFVNAVQQLAGTYSRLVTTTEVAGPAAQRVGLPVAEVSERLSASPVPETSIIAVEATAPDQADAVALVQAASQSLVEYVQDQNTPPSDEDATLQDYRAASVDLNAAQVRVQQAEQAVGRAVPGTPAAVEAETALVQARADAAAARLRVDTLANVFANNQRGGTERNNLQIINEPAALGSDRASSIALAVAVSLVLGLTLGLGLATAVANIGQLRALRHAGDPAATGR